MLLKRSAIHCVLRSPAEITLSEGVQARNVAAPLRDGSPEGPLWTMSPVLQDKRRVLYRWAAELRRIIGEPVEVSVADAEMRLAA